MIVAFTTNEPNLESENNMKHALYLDLFFIPFSIPVPCGPVSTLQLKPL